MRIFGVRLFSKSKDGGPQSRVTGYWLIEWKSVLSIALLRFDDGTREAYHSHAFDAVSWILGPGWLREQHVDGRVKQLHAGWRPVVTLRDTFHKVRSYGRTWAITFRGPWTDTWKERHRDGQYVVLTHGRQVVSS